MTDYGPKLLERIEQIVIGESQLTPDSPFSFHSAAMPLFIRRMGEHELPKPRCETELSAGMDLRCVDRVVLLAGERMVVETGFAFEIPPHLYGQIAPRSGLALKMGLDVLAGVIDADYRGEIKVVLINHGEEALMLPPGARIAQLLLKPICTSDYVTVEIDELEESSRGEGGLGSTGER
jgi:dUTP pyrophosphatase